MTNIGISQGFHDAGLAIVNDCGSIVHASHSERYSKNKNDPLLHEAQLKQASVHGGEINYYERPWATNLRRLYAGQKPSSLRSLKSNLSYFQLPTKMRTWRHHLSHAASAFQTSPFDHSAVVVVDAIGEWETASIWYAYYDNNGNAKYQKLWSQSYPHSIGLFYSAMTQRVGLKPMEDEYILMGMATYGVPSMLYERMRKEFVDSIDETRFKQNMHAGVGDWAKQFKDEHIAAATQKLTEEMLYSIHERAERITNETNVCYAGGVALNCKFNTRLSNLWSKIWICPNPGDCGAALGAAALGYGKKLNWNNAFLGYEIGGELDVNAVVQTLKQKQIVGVANGAAEWGPRALGNRSLLADPRPNNIKDRVNQIKRRQNFRPFAPAILAEHASDYFEMNSACDYRYMQYAIPATEKGLHVYPNSCHVDGTARVQVVPQDGSNMRKVLEAWYAATGCPMLINTSLNIKGQPIVNDKKDAKNFTDFYGVSVIT